MQQTVGSLLCVLSVTPLGMQAIMEHVESRGGSCGSLLFLDLHCESRETCLDLVQDNFS